MQFHRVKGKGVARTLGSQDREVNSIDPIPILIGHAEDLEPI